MGRKWSGFIIVANVILLMCCAPINGSKAGRRNQQPERGNRAMISVQNKLRDTEEQLQSLREQVTRLANELSGFDSEPPCPNNVAGFFYSELTSSCYHLEPQDIFANWSEAKMICQHLHPQAHLVSIETEQEHKYLAKKWQNDRGIGSLSRFWTSGKLMGSSWMWASIGAVISDTYNNWLPIAPHDDERFACLAVFSNEAYYWSAVACWAPHMITCEMSP